MVSTSFKLLHTFTHRRNSSLHCLSSSKPAIQLHKTTAQRSLRWRYTVEWAIFSESVPEEGCIVYQFFRKGPWSVVWSDPAIPYRRQKWSLPHSICYPFIQTMGNFYQYFHMGFGFGRLKGIDQPSPKVVSNCCSTCRSGPKLPQSPNAVVYSQDRLACTEYWRSMALYISHHRWYYIRVLKGWRSVLSTILLFMCTVKMFS